MLSGARQAAARKMAALSLAGRFAGRLLRRAGGLAVPRRRSSGPSSVPVELDEEAGVAVVRLQQPPVNELSLPLLTELCLALQKLEDRRGCRGLVLTSGVRGVFSAGLDIRELCGRSEERLAEFWRTLQDAWILLYGSRLATVAAVNGSSPAGGCLLALSCDYRIMADNPKYSIGLNETRLGIVAPFWFRDCLLNTVGHRATERSLQLGLLHSPQEALRMGLVDQLVPEEKIQAAAAEAMAQWLAVPDHARQLSKSLLRKHTLDQLLRHREADIESFVSFVSRDAIQKSLQKYLELLKQKKT